MDWVAEDEEHAQQEPQHLEEEKPILSAPPPPLIVLQQPHEKKTLISSSSATTSYSSLTSSSSFAVENTDFNSFSRAQQRISFSGITNSEAHGEVYKERVRGPLYKKGFRFRKAWVPRWVVLTGRMLRYYSNPTSDDDITSQRGSVELTSDTVVSYEHFALTGDNNASTARDKNQEFGFIVFIHGIPARNSTSSAAAAEPVPWYRAEMDKWCFRASSEREREMWMDAINKVVYLIRRADMLPILMGVGKITSHFDFGREIGKGKFGTVTMAKAQANGLPFAVRIVNKSRISHNHAAASKWNRESVILKKIHSNHFFHRNITYLYFVFEEPFNLFFVRDLLVYGSLEQRIPMKERDAANIVHQLASALHALHDLGVVVVNLHPKKLLFQNALTIKINNFASAHQVLTEVVTLTEPVSSGEPGYLAPELLTHRQISRQGDLWTLGVLLAHMMTGKRPFANNEEVKRAGAVKLVAANGQVSAECQDLIAKLTVSNRTKRVQTAQEVLQHPFVKRKLFSFRAVARSIVVWLRLAQSVIPKKAPAPAVQQPSKFGFIPKTKSYTEIRNEQWTLDALAKRARDERMGSSDRFLSSALRLNSGRSVSTTGFTAMGISSSIAGQMSEYGELQPVVSKPGPFMSALEDFLDDEAEGFEDSDLEEEEEEEEDDEEVLQYAAVPLPAHKSISMPLIRSE